jgi:PTH1 family peptidyl-tRNA hydrolase
LIEGSPAKLIVGLRNPGSRYTGTRHNIGGDAVANFCHEQGASFKRARQGIRAEISELTRGEQRVILVLPLTFMNESGQAVAPSVRYFGIERDDLLVVHDDIDLPFGKLKVQWAGGHGGNNGVRSTAASMKSPDFWRLKIGVGRPPGRMDPADYVLSKFRGSEREDIGVSVARAGDVMEDFISSGGESARQSAGESND